MAEITVSDATLVLEDAGAGAAVLLLHGFPATRHLWAQVAPALRTLGRRTLAPDLAGYGDSHVPPDTALDVASQARRMLELLDVLGIARAVVVAHDVGSAAAQLMLARAPERVSGIAILDGVYAQEWAMHAIESIRDWNPQDAHRLYPVLARRLGTSPALRNMLAAYQGSAGGLRLIRAAQALAPEQTAQLGVTLAACRVPALVLWGEHDAFLPVDSVARPLAALLHAPLVLVPGGHFTPLESPAAVANALQAFLGGAG